MYAHIQTHTHTVRKMVTICYSCAALVLLTVLCVPSVYSYSAGAREESCYNMEAAHVDTISGNNRSSNDCFQFGACQFSVEVVGKVDFGSGSGDGGSTGTPESITTYECDQVYEGNPVVRLQQETHVILFLHAQQYLSLPIKISLRGTCLRLEQQQHQATLMKPPQFGESGK